jgi:hypothetical protein
MDRLSVAKEYMGALLPDAVASSSADTREEHQDVIRGMLDRVAHTLAQKVEKDLSLYALSTKEQVDAYCRILDDAIATEREQCLARIVEIVEKEDWEKVWKQFASKLLDIRLAVREELYKDLSTDINKAPILGGGVLLPSVVSEHVGVESENEEDGWVDLLEKEVDVLQQQVNTLEVALVELRYEYRVAQDARDAAEHRITQLVQQEQTAQFPAVDVGDMNRTRAIEAITDRVGAIQAEQNSLEKFSAPWQEREGDLLGIRARIHDRMSVLEDIIRQCASRKKILDRGEHAALQDLKKEQKKAEVSLVACQKFMSSHFDAEFAHVQSVLHSVEEGSALLRSKIQRLHAVRADMFSAGDAELRRPFHVADMPSKESFIRLMAEADIVCTDDGADVFSGGEVSVSAPSKEQDLRSSDRVVTAHEFSKESDEFIAAATVQDALDALRQTDRDELKNLFPEYFFSKRGVRNEGHSLKAQQEFIDRLQKNSYIRCVQTACVMLLEAGNGDRRAVVTTNQFGAFTRRNECNSVFPSIGISSGSEIGGQLFADLSMLGRHTSDMRVIEREQGAFTLESGKSFQSNTLTSFGVAAAKHWREVLQKECPDVYAMCQSFGVYMRNVRR